VSERTLLQVALARLDDAALAVMRSAATEDEQHEILGCLVGAHSLLSALVRIDPAAVDELIRRAIQLRRHVGQPKTAAAENAWRRDQQAGHKVAGTPAGRLAEVGPASPTTSITTAEIGVEVAAHAVGA
jgi:hypothetical protein